VRGVRAKTGQENRRVPTQGWEKRENGMIRKKRGGGAWELGCNPRRKLDIKGGTGPTGGPPDLSFGAIGLFWKWGRGAPKKKFRPIISVGLNFRRPAGGEAEKQWKRFPAGGGAGGAPIPHRATFWWLPLKRDGAGENAGRRKGNNPGRRRENDI